MKNTHLLRALLAIVAAILVAAPAARAQVFVFYSDTDQILNAAGAPANGTVRIGTFTSGFNFGANTYDFSTLNANFTEFDTATLTNGKFSDSFNASGAQLGKQIFLWALDSTVSPTQWVILTNTTDTTNWTVPQAAGDFAVVDPIEQGTFIPAGALGVGVFNGAYPAGDTNQTDWKMQAIPEPSTYALIGLGAVGMMGLRRRIKR